MSAPFPARLLIVDLCGTLIAENTTNDFIDRWISLRGWRRICRRVLRRKRITSVFALRGIDRTSLYDQADKYVSDRLQRIPNQLVLGAIRKAKRANMSVYLATASLDPIATAVVRQLCLDGMVTAQLKYDREGFCTGFFSVDPTGEKLVHLRRLLEDAALRQATVYTDNREDVDLLRIAAEPHYLGSPGDLTSLSAQERERITFHPSILPREHHAIL